MHYQLNAPVSPKSLADLRQAVGWNRMQRDLSDSRLQNAFHLCCFDGESLIGYTAVVSNGVTDAYIQDLMVHPQYQHQGIGRQLMQLTMGQLRAMGIYMVSVVYGDSALKDYYEQLGFSTMLCGQIELRPGRD